MVKKYLIYLLGLVILYFGIPLIATASLGADSLTCFVYIMSTIISVQMGTMLTIINIIFLIIHFIKFRNLKFILIGFVASLAAGLIVNLGMHLFSFIPLNIGIQIVLFILGFIMLSSGVAVILRSDVQKMPYESMMEVLADIFKKDINFIRVFVEVGFAIVAFIIFMIMRVDKVILFQYFNFGTVFIMLLTGPCVHFIYKKILKGE